MPSKKKPKAKDIGIPISPPEKECKDPRCAWHGSLPVRGRVFKGTVRSAKSHNTVIVEWGYHRFIRKYERYQRQKSRLTAHNPACMRAREGDAVVIAECRPIAKTKHFVVVGFQKDLGLKPQKETEGVKRHLPANV
jgi:small subunit ribosomal protein S17